MDEIPRPTDNEIIEAVYAAKNKNIARRMLWRYPNDVDDVIQDSAWAAVRKADQYRGDSLLTTWAARIVINRALAFLRSRSCKKEPRTLDGALDRTKMNGLRLHEILPSSEPLPDEVFARNETAERISMAISRLPKLLRDAAINLYEERSIKESANLRGASVEAEKAVRFRARARLRNKLQEFAPAA